MVTVKRVLKHNNSAATIGRGIWYQSILGVLSFAASELGNAYMPSSAWRRSRPSQVSKADATKPCLVASQTRKAELC